MIVELACHHLKIDYPSDPEHFLNHIHDLVTVENLNSLRLAIFRGMNDLSWLRPTYFSLGRSNLFSLVGNELAMQNRVNPSIQLPMDNSSLLDIHSDIFSGETPFQVVQWLPLVSVSGKKSMFILSPEKSKAVVKNLKDIGDMPSVYEVVQQDLKWLDIPYGHVLIFDSSCLHGNVVNDSLESRWSLNCRFTGLFTPYTSYEKKLGSFYLPITTRAATKIGIRYVEPGGFKE